MRSVMVSQADVRTYVHAATYDSHNRVRTITYPDGEVVTYGYDAAGQVTSIRSTKQGKEETIYSPHVRGKNVSAFIVRSVIHK